MGQCTVQCARLNNAIYRHWSCGARSCVSPPKYARLSSKGAATQVVVTVDCFHTVTVWSDHVTPNATRRKTKERSPLRHSRPRGGRGGDAYPDGVSQHALDRQRLRQRRRLANSQRPRRTQTWARQKATINTRPKRPAVFINRTETTVFRRGSRACWTVRTAYFNRRR